MKLSGYWFGSEGQGEKDPWAEGGNLLRARAGKDSRLLVTGPAAPLASQCPISRAPCQLLTDVPTTSYYFFETFSQPPGARTQ